MATLTCYITANGDDGYEWVSAWNVDGDAPGNKYSGRYGGDYNYLADRFQVNLAAGATINSVTWNLYKAGDQTGTPILSIYADDVDSAAQPSGSALPSARTSTTATVSKSLTAGEWGTAGWVSIDVTSVFSEVYARGGWAANNYIMLIMVGTAAQAGGDYVGFEDYSNSNSNHSYITIDYTAAGADTTPPTFSVAPAVTPSSSGGTATATIDETGDIFYVVVADGASAPSSAQVLAGQNASGAAALAAGSDTAGTVLSDVFTGLSASTAYDAYFVARDDEGTPNVQASPTKVDFTTSAAGGSKLLLQLMNS